MPYETDEKLKSFLDANQLHREQLCAAILAIDARFSGVTPQHPRGGPDGGTDIVAKFEGHRPAIGAVGFINQATDSATDKRRIKKKALDDVRRAASAVSPSVFVFFTNVNLTRAERDQLISAAQASGFSVCEIFDRERLRLLLDSPDGLAIRYQYLGISLSDAEQAAFFSKWGSKINDVIADGFGQTHRLLNRIQFLHEYRLPIKYLRFVLHIKDDCSISDVGPVRLYARLIYDASKGSMVGHQFSMTESTPKSNLAEGGSFSVNTLELHMKDKPYYLDPECWNHYDYEVIPADRSYVSYSGHSETIRFAAEMRGTARTHGISLSDLDGSYLYIYANRSLALSLSRIEFYSDLYKIDGFGSNMLRGLNIEEFKSGFATYREDEEDTAESLLRIGQCYAHSISTLPARRPSGWRVPTNLPSLS